MAEYSKDNRFPFYQKKDKMVSVQEDTYEDIYELQLIYDKIVEKFKPLMAENFYSQISQIDEVKPIAKREAMMRSACDSLFKNIKNCIEDEKFIHGLYDSYGFGIEKVISTLYAVYGYYFFTGKRAANAIKKTIDGYKRKPEY